MFSRLPDLTATKRQLQAQAQPTVARTGRGATMVGVGVFVMLLGALAALVYVPIPTPNENAFNIFLGALIGYGTAVVSFFFGSSQSAVAKEEANAQTTQKLVDAATGSQGAPPDGTVNLTAAPDVDVSVRAAGSPVPSSPVTAGRLPDQDLWR